MDSDVSIANECKDRDGLMPGPRSQLFQWNALPYNAIGGQGKIHINSFPGNEPYGSIEKVHLGTGK